jgi:hypothetical protein
MVTKKHTTAHAASANTALAGTLKLTIPADITDS